MKVINVPVNCTVTGGTSESASPYATLFLCNIIRNIIREGRDVLELLLTIILNM